MVSLAGLGYTTKSSSLFDSTANDYEQPKQNQEYHSHIDYGAENLSDAFTINSLIS
jgi:hypothetical protein